MATTERIAHSLPKNPASPERAGQSVLERIGNTPLLRLERIAKEFPNVEFCAKAEWFNPGGSVKDRPALSMIQAGLQSGALSSRQVIIEATSGHTRPAYPTNRAGPCYAPQ